MSPSKKKQIIERFVYIEMKFVFGHISDIEYKLRQFKTWLVRLKARED